MWKIWRSIPFFLICITSYYSTLTSAKMNEWWAERNSFQVRYRQNTPLILKGITVSIKGGEKVGVVGRTGSGKSTLVQALFRIVEPADGHIIIDGVNICTLGLRDLRSRFGVIPQEPVLFEGTVRSNIDPARRYSEAEIWQEIQSKPMLCWTRWAPLLDALTTYCSPPPPSIKPDLAKFTSLQALECCQLKDIVASKPEKLDALGYFAPFQTHSNSFGGTTSRNTNSVSLLMVCCCSLQSPTWGRTGA